MSDLIIHSATLVTDGAVTPHAWVAFDGATVAATGTGEGWREGRTPATVVRDAEGDYLVPGFIDIHCHGGNAAAFDDGAAAITDALAVHRAHGTTRSVISLVSGDHDTMVGSLAVIAELAAHDPLVLGSHLEGPFLNRDFKGAHDPAVLRNPTSTEISQLLAAAEGTLAQITIAPELDGAPAAITQLGAASVAVAVGHSAADYEQTCAAFDAGARILTHAFNGMKGIHHRAPGPVAAAISREHVTIEVINDGVHVHQDVIKMLGTSAPDRVALITDAMAAAGANDGHYLLGSLDVTVLDGVARLSEGGAIAGSTLTMDAAVRRTIVHRTMTLPAAIAAATSVPAHAMGRGGDLGSLAVGFAADAVLLDAGFRVLAVWAAGRELSRSGHPVV